jgi:hypothetical protein
VGTYTQISNNYHAYTDTITPLFGLEDEDWPDPYEAFKVHPRPMFEVLDARGDQQLKEDLAIFFEHDARESLTKARWPWLRQVAAPMVMAHRHWKRTRGPDRLAETLEIVERVQAEDWRLAARGWVVQAAARLERAKDDGVSYDHQSV